MPAHRLAGPVDIGQYDVVGLDSEQESGFVRHVALSHATVLGHQPANSLLVTHMGPPLALADDGGTVQTLGVLPLTAGERSAIHTFITDLDLERKAQVARLKLQTKSEALAENVIGMAQYCIRPHQETYSRSFLKGVIQLRRFSCAGFVLAAYEDAGVALLDTDESNLPEVKLETLCAAYPDYESDLTSETIREKRNLPGQGPWRVVLAGYVINALASTNPSEPNPRAHLPYRPQPGDEYYPSRKQIPGPVTAKADTSCTP